MYIGAVKFHIHIPYAKNLKDKRRVLNSLIQKLNSEFKILVNEIDHLDQWQSAILGLTIVANETKAIQPRLDKIIYAIRNTNQDFLLVDYQQQTLKVF